MIAGFVRGQTLRLSVPRIAADTIDYLTAKFLFQSSDWDGLEKWVHFALGDAAYDIRLTDDEITADAHLNLTAGKWTVYLHGNRYADGRVIQRVTTETQTLDVFPTGTLDGEPFPTVPPSAGEQIIASAAAAEAGAKAAAAEARQAADEAAQYEPEVFWAKYNQTSYAEVKTAYDNGMLCCVWMGSTILRLVASRQRSIDNGITYKGYFVFAAMLDSGEVEVAELYEDRGWLSMYEYMLTKSRLTDSINATSTNDKVPTAKATYDAIQTYSDPAITEALRKAKESGEFDGAAGTDGDDGITPHIGANGNWWIGDTDTGIAAQGNPGEDYVLTEADKEEIAGMIPGGGSGESDIFNVTLTTNEDGSITASHTSQEIYAAAQEGKTITLLSVVDGFVQSCVPVLITADFVAFYNVFAADTSDYDVSVTMVGIAGSDVLTQTATIDKMIGASANSDGTVGLVPQPLTGQQDYILHGDGAWRKPAETISDTSANTEIPSAKAVYDAIQGAIPDSGDSSGGGGVVIFSVLYTDEQASFLEAPVVYPEGADMDALLAAGQAQMVMLTPSDSEDVPTKLGVLLPMSVDVGGQTIVFAGTITGKDGNEAVMAELHTFTGEITITPMVQNSAGSGSSGGGGVVTITDNGDGTFTSSHTPAEIAAMAQTGAVVAVWEEGVIPLMQYNADMAVFNLFMIEDSAVGCGVFTVTNDGVSFEVIYHYVGEMHGADTDNAGTGGTVPAPAAGEQNMVLHGDGTWRAALSEEDKMDLVTRVLEKLPTWEGGTY